MLPTMPLSDHLEDLRRMIFRIIAAVIFLAIVIFCFKEEAFRLLLAPKEYDFVTYRAIERLSDIVYGWCGYGEGFRFEPYQVDLISTELSAQFMMHITASCCIGALIASPYILYQVFLFILPALYDNERRYSLAIGIAIFVLFVLGVLMTYFILFPISFRFLGTYQVDPSIRNVITLDSYITTFATLTFLMGLVFQLPVLAWILAKMHLVNDELMSRYRRHAFVAIMIVAALITPPDVFTLALVTLPLYMLYEFCIRLVRRVRR